MEVKISVIIPVFNAEKHLNFCIDSLLKQTFDFCEFIFINDGSKDNSKSILEDFQKQDSRIVLINQENKGVSVARNYGLKIAKGKYISFIDADDYIDENFLSTLYNTAIQFDAEIVISNFVFEQNNKWIISKSLFPVYEIFEKDYIQKNICTFLLKNDSLNSCCNKLFKKEFICVNSINFPVGKENSEDAFYTLKAFSMANKVIFTDYSGYYYREVQGSASRNIVNKDYFKNAIEIYTLNHKEIFKLEIDVNKIKVLKGIRLINSVMALIHIYFKSNNIGFLNKYIYVKKIINNSVFKQVIFEYWNDINNEVNFYKRLFLICLKFKFIYGIILLADYSNFRNKNIE
jgi:glycosyltransferase involved in cell wall biosynthesis